MNTSTNGNNRFKKALLAGATLALLMGGLSITATEAQAATNLGGVSMQRACEKQYPAQGRTARVLDGRNAYSWVCTTPWGYRGGIDVNRACRDTYGTRAYAQLRDTRNPYTWYCTK